MIRRWIRLLATSAAVGLVACALPPAHAQSDGLGPFDAHAAIGAVEATGGATYDPSAQVLRLEGAGHGLQDPSDALHAAWTRVGGDVLLVCRDDAPPGRPVLRRHWSLVC